MSTRDKPLKAANSPDFSQARPNNAERRMKQAATASSEHLPARTNCCAQKGPAE
jgi:hypothetical protein